MEGFLDLDCGITVTRIVAWLDDELALRHSPNGWVFATQDGTCLVKAEPLESRTIGPISLERTRLVAHGDSDTLAAFEKLFTLRFVSAGG